MAFAPSNQIRLRHVPFDDTYRHVFDFGSSSAQFNYFNGLSGYNFNNFTYQRKDDIIRVPVNAESLYNINYVMYQNANFGDKWFYAFVTKIEYVNDNTSFLHIKTDVWQTWLFNWSIDQCFVERMHAPYDTLGEWEEPEPLAPEAYPREAYRLTPQTDFSHRLLYYIFQKSLRRFPTLCLVRRTAAHFRPHIKNFTLPAVEAFRLFKSAWLTWHFWRAPEKWS